MSNKIVEAKTVQTNAIKQCNEALKEILTDANIEWNEKGLKIITLDPSNTILVHLKLEKENFEYFHCEKRMFIGINVLNLFKLLRTLTNNDALTLYLEEGNESKLGIKIENSEKNTMTKYMLNLMDLHEDNIQIPPAVFDSVITMPSVDFQKICRDMHNLAENIEIKSLENQLIFSCSGQFASQETSIGETNSGLSFVQNQNPDEIVQGIFALKHLVLFSKCTNLCNNIELYLKNDYPLILKYQVASLGSIKLCLAPKCDNE